jgi:hypothetical protein
MVLFSMDTGSTAIKIGEEPLIIPQYFATLSAQEENQDR